MIVTYFLQDEEPDDLQEIDNIDFEALQSLSDDGIDMSFLDNLKVRIMSDTQLNNFQDFFKREFRKKSNEDVNLIMLCYYEIPLF